MIAPTGQSAGTATLMDPPSGVLIVTVVPTWLLIQHKHRKSVDVTSSDGQLTEKTILPIHKAKQNKNAQRIEGVIPGPVVGWEVWEDRFQ
jgi:hypothetical protein